MRLFRHGPLHAERPGMVAPDGRHVDLTGVIEDIAPETLSPAALKKIANTNLATLPEIAEGARFGVPVHRIGKVIAIGLNYSDHALEAGLDIPTEPVVFSKAITSLSGPNDDVILPENSIKGDWEVELGIVIGSAARYVAKEDALSCIAGFTLANDVSEREWQWDHGGTWDKGKGFDTFLPLGPYVVTAEEVGDPQKLDIWLDVNGQRRQSGNTETMIFDCATIVAYISRLMTLMPGDVIITGTPPGVGMGIKPEPIYLKPGDIMELGIEGLGTQRQVVHAFDPEILPQVAEVAA